MPRQSLGHLRGDIGETQIGDERLPQTVKVQYASVLVIARDSCIFEVGPEYLSRAHISNWEQQFSVRRFRDASFYDISDIQAKRKYVVLSMIGSYGVPGRSVQN